MEESRRQLQELLDQGNAREAVRVMKGILDRGWIVEEVGQRGAMDGVLPGFAAARAEIALPVHTTISHTSQMTSLQPVVSTIPYPGHVAPFSIGIGSRNPTFPSSDYQDLPIPTIPSQRPPSEEEDSVTESMHL